MNQLIKLAQLVQQNQGTLIKIAETAAVMVTLVATVAHTITKK
jgi:hypothetical protein